MAMRNPNGFGTVFKMPGRRRKPWVARITTGWKKTIVKRGKNKGKEVPRQTYQIIGYFKTKQEGIDALAMHRIDPVSPRVNITLKELYKEWSMAKYEYISKATADNYRAAWKRLSQYEKTKVKDLRAAHLQAIIDKCHKESMSRSSLEKIRTLAVMLFDYAMQNDIVNKNYAKFINLPKFDKTEKTRFSNLEIKKIEEAAKTIPWADTILIMIYTGMRISEMLNLTRFNVDIESELITGGVKTEAGKNRVIPIHSKIKKYIKQWYKKKGEALICDENGKPIQTRKYREELYRPALEKIEGVRVLNPHACRHTFGSLMAEAGVEPIITQKLIGHADYSTTANIYTHLEIEALKKAINKI